MDAVDPTLGDVPRRRPWWREGDSSPPYRPLAAVAGGLAGGQLIALWPEAWSPLAAVWCGVTAIAIAASLARGPGVWLWLALLIGATGRTGWSLRVLPAPVGGQGSSVEVARVERVRGQRVQLAARGAGGLDRDGWELAFEAAPPAEGEWIALLPPGERRAWVTPPLDVPLPRDSRGVRSVGVDESVRLSGPPRGALHALGGAWTELSRRLRARVRARCDASGATGGTGLAPALTIGDRDALDRDLSDLFTRTGTRHLLALSGLHVGLLGLLVLRPLGRALGALWQSCGGTVRAARRVDLLTRLAGLGLFTLAAGGSAPVVRAALALGAMTLAEHLPAPSHGDGLVRGRRPDGLSIWSLALVLECLADPLALREVGVTLSYAATLGILLWSTGLARRLRLGDATARRRRQERRWMHGRLLVLVAVVAERAGGLVRASVACSIAAVLATLPIQWAVFGEIAPMGIVATVALAPTIALHLVLSWCAVLGANGLAIDALRGLEGTMVFLLERCDDWPASPLLLPERRIELVVLACVATLLGWTAGRRRLLACGATSLVLLGWRARVEPDGLWIDLLDVGHGTACVIQAPGAPAVVFDAGSLRRPGIVSTALAPTARSRGWTSVLAVASHADRDHWSGLPWLASRLDVERWLGDGSARDRAGSVAPLLDLERTPASAALELEGGLRLTLVRGASSDDNEGSRSLLVEWRGRRALLCGDATGPGLSASMDALGERPGPVDLLLLPHHGGHGDGVGPLLDAVAAEQLWVSAAARPPLADELDRRGLHWLCTSENGPLQLRLGPRPPDRSP